MIGFLSWVGLAYSFKFLWSPLVDRVDVPLLGRLGRRRGWMLLSQIVVGAGLSAWPSSGRGRASGSRDRRRWCVAFASATQDIVIDAWRIEAAETERGAGPALLRLSAGLPDRDPRPDALIIFVASHLGWPVSYVRHGGADGDRRLARR